MDILHIKSLLYHRRCLFTVLELDVRLNLWVMPPNSHCSLFPISLLCVLTRITLELQAIYECSAYRMTALLSKTFLVWLRVAPDTSQSFSDKSLYAYTASPYIDRYLVHNLMTAYSFVRGRIKRAAHSVFVIQHTFWVTWLIQHTFQI